MSRICVIDNTSLVVIRGSGPRAVFSPEMVQFARPYSFTWLAHEINHSDRKAGVERGFWTIETNFFPGREFSSLEDLNKQAFDWCEARSKKMNKKKQIPIDLFNFEKDYMTKINLNMSGPYEQTSRVVDQEGYMNFNANSYWVGLRSSSIVSVLEYPSEIQIYSERKKIAEYALPSFDVKNKRVSPNGMEHVYRPKKITILPTTQEQELRSLGKQFDEYLNFALKELGPQGRYQLIREIYFLHKKLPIKIFTELIERAQRYNVNQKNSLETMAAYLIGQDKDTFIFDPLLEDLKDIGTINDLYIGHEGEGNERE